MATGRARLSWRSRSASLLAGAIAVLVAAAIFAVLSRGPGAPTAAAAAPLDQVYKFDADGALPLYDRSELPVAPGSVIAHWYTFRGWYVVVFEGLDLTVSGPLCLGTSILNATTHQIEHLSNSPTTDSGCDTSGAGQVAHASAPTGVRVCERVVSYITGIPAETEGVLYASLAAFRGDGTGLGMSSRLETTQAQFGELGSATLSCGSLPVGREIPPPLPTPELLVNATPAPASTGSVAAANRAPPPSPTKSRYCAPVERGGLEDVTDGPAAPYFIHRSAPDRPNAPTVVFLAGGSGGRVSAERLWNTVFAGRSRADDFQVVIPYSTEVNFIDEAPRTLAIVNEVLSCYGGDPADVHLAGTSNGGLAAFAVMAAHPEYFATLLGAPGAFPVQDPATIDEAVLARTLAGRAVFNGVGAYDGAWKAEVIATHNALAAAGIESVYFEFPSAGHLLNEAFDPNAFFDFWASH